MRMKLAILTICGLLAATGCAKPYQAGQLTEQQVTPPVVDLSPRFKACTTMRDNDCAAVAVARVGGFYLGQQVNAEEISQIGRIWPSLALQEAQGKGWFSKYTSIPAAQICEALDAGCPVVVAVKMPKGNHTAVIAGYGFLYYVVMDSYPGLYGRWLASSTEYNGAIMGAWKIEGPVSTVGLADLLLERVGHEPMDSFCVAPGRCGGRWVH